MSDEKFNLLKQAAANLKAGLVKPQVRYLPRTDIPKYVAPLGVGFLGALERKPFEYRVTVCIPHLDTLDQLNLAIEMWRCQTVKPYICVIDTGSSWDVCSKLEHEVRSHDVEVHFVRGHGYRHSSEPVTAALDLAHTRCDTEYLFHTHSDVFPMRRDFIEYMMKRCTHLNPVVGWQMSERSLVYGSPTTHEWRDCVSHTATMIHMPVARRARLTWAMEAYYAHRPKERGATIGWPDTESPFMLACKESKIVPDLLGNELNTAHILVADEKEWAAHARSYTSLKMIGNEEDKKWEAAKQYTEEIERDAKARLKLWNDANYCANRSQRPIGTVECPSCSGKVELKVYDCSVKGKCLVDRNIEGYINCNGCDRKARAI